jgi:demethylmenaquinone methyltransferase/2-methoxy-6-polyprenyl-1,4-benzoquinol methylase
MQEDIYTPTYVKGLFDRMSTSYERMNFLTSFGFSIRWRRQFLELLPATDAPIEVMDLLTGMGETWGWTKQRFPQAKLTVLDFSDGMLKYALAKSLDKYQGEVVVLQQDILQNKLPSEHFDIVTCAFGLKTFNSAQLEVLAQETKRILKPGGYFTFVEVSKPEALLLRALYGLYLGRIIPILGRLLLYDPEEYKMLWCYTESCGNAKEAMRIFQRAGLKAQYTSYFHGCATGFHGVKLRV